MQANQITPMPIVMPVEVALGDRGAAEPAGDAAAEHVGEPAAAALVEQDQQDQQEAGR